MTDTSIGTLILAFVDVRGATHIREMHIDPLIKHKYCVVFKKPSLETQACGMALWITHVR
jgi:hypothetical protein